MKKYGVLPLLQPLSDFCCKYNLRTKCVFFSYRLHKPRSGSRQQRRATLPLQSKTKGKGVLHLRKLLQPASTSTTNHFHLLLLTWQSPGAGTVGTVGTAGTAGGARAHPGAASAHPRCGSRTSAPGLCHSGLQPGETGSPLSLETTKESEKAAGEEAGELLCSAGTRLCNGAWVRQHGAAPGAGGGERLPSNRPGAAAPALRPGTLRGKGSAAAAPGLRRLPVETCCKQVIFSRRKASPAGCSRTQSNGRSRRSSKGEEFSVGQIRAGLQQQSRRGLLWPCSAGEVNLRPSHQPGTAEALGQPSEPWRAGSALTWGLAGMVQHAGTEGSSSLLVLSLCTHSHAARCLQSARSPLHVGVVFAFF